MSRLTSNLSSRTGGSAYGMPRNPANSRPFLVLIIRPDNVPFFIFTSGALAATSSNRQTHTKQNFNRLLRYLIIPKLNERIVRTPCILLFLYQTLPIYKKKKRGKSRSDYESAIIRIDDNNRDEYNDFCNSRQFLLLIIPWKILDQMYRKQLSHGYNRYEKATRLIQLIINDTVDG